MDKANQLKLRAEFFKQLGCKPIPGDTVKVNCKAHNQDLRGRCGVVKCRWPDVMVEIDGKEHHLTFNSLDIIGGPSSGK